MKRPAIDARSRRRLRRLGRMPLISPRLWLRRVTFWIGAILVALVAIGFARAADWAVEANHRLLAGRPWLTLVVGPAALAVSLVLTRRFFPGAQGSGIPQVIAALHIRDEATVARVLSPRIATGKVLLTLLGLVGGASIGREGPTVQVGASIMFGLGRRLRLPREELRHALVLAGGAAGIAAAFNTPLAGVMFAIEELSHSFRARTSGIVFTAVAVAGITALGISGNYVYFGRTSATLAFGAGWVAVPLCAVTGGFAGGLFSTILLRAADGFPGRAGQFPARHPMLFAALCGLAIAALGLVSDGTTYGTGYAQARSIVEGRAELPALFAPLKLAASVVSYISGIPGGIFAPSLAVGAGIGQWLAALAPGADTGAVVLLGMVAYFCGVVQAPITATLIVMEMTDNQAMTIPLMATSFLAFGVSRLVCRRPLYGALAQRFLRALGRGAAGAPAPAPAAIPPPA